MKLVTWQATVKDDTTGAIIINPVITVRKDSDDSLAPIYNLAGGAIGNPITGGIDGFVQFQVMPGRYKIEGAKSGVLSPDWYIDAMPDEGLAYTTRAEFKSDLDAGMVLPDGAVVIAGSVHYEFGSTFTSISDLIGVRLMDLGDVNVRQYDINIIDRKSTRLNSSH